MLGEQWRKPSRSHTNGCVEVAHNTDEGMVLVRDTKLGDASPILSFPAAAWQVLLDDVRAGTFVFGRFYPLSFNRLEVEAFVVGVFDGEFDLPAEAEGGASAMTELGLGPPYLCVYCTDGPHLERAEVTEHWKRWLAWEDARMADPNPPCLYYPDHRHPAGSLDQLACEGRWVEANR
jgi:hypothetical protein